MKRALLLAAVLVVLGAGSAEAVTIEAPPASPVPYQEWADASLVPLPPIRLAVAEIPFGGESCGPSGEPACTYPGGPIILAAAWFLEGGQHPWGELRHTYMHEVGHQFDYAVLSDAERGRFRGLIGDSRPWRALGGNSPHETFADVFANCALKRSLRWNDWLIGTRLYPTARAHRRLCRAVRTYYWF